MMRNGIKWSILLLMTLLWSACNSSKNADPYYKISDSFKQYCLFQTGSRWVYQNDSTLTQDTLKISDMQSYVAFHSPDNVAGPYSFDVVDIMFDTTNRFNIFKGSITAGNPTTGTGTMNDQYWLFFKNGDYLLAFAPGFPQGEEQRLGNGPGYYTNIEKLPDYKVNGKQYSEVYHAQVRKPEGNADTVNYQFYFALHYGLIKWTRHIKNETESYSLIYSQLTQQ